MRKANLFLTFCLCVLVVVPSFVLSAEHPSPKRRHAEKFPVTIEVIADSLNRLEAQVQVSPETHARDLLVRLFQVDFADRGKKFVRAIAGFRAEPRRKEYWSLEIDGVYSKVGIAEIILNKPTRILWRKKRY